MADEESSRQPVVVPGSTDPDKCFAQLRSQGRYKSLVQVSVGSPFPPPTIYVKNKFSCRFWSNSHFFSQNFPLTFRVNYWWSWTILHASVARRNSRGDKKCCPREHSRKLEHRVAQSQCDASAIVIFVQFFLQYNTYVF